MKKIQGIVIHGKALGRTIGFPTANIFMKKNTVTEGTYKINIVYNKVVYKGIGVARNELELFEAHIFDFQKDIYDHTIEVIILEKLRENRKFSSLEELKIQIQADQKQAQQSEITGMVFGSFDVVHEGHKYFLQEAHKYCDSLICVIATDYNIKKLKQQNPHFSQDERKQHIEELGIADRVEIGDEQNPMKWLTYYQPSIVCLGYDQIGFSQTLTKDFPDIHIVRIDSYKEYIYKSSLLKEKK